MYVNICFFIYWSEQVNHGSSAFYWFLFSTVKFLRFSVRFYFYYNTEGIFFFREKIEEVQNG